MPIMTVSCPALSRPPSFSSTWSPRMSSGLSRRLSPDFNNSVSAAFMVTSSIALRNGWSSHEGRPSRPTVEYQEIDSTTALVAKAIVWFPHTACLSLHADLVGSARAFVADLYLSADERVVERLKNAKTLSSWPHDCSL